MASAESVGDVRGAIALQGVYEVTKLLVQSRAPRDALPEMLDALCEFWELHDAGVALWDRAQSPELFRRGDNPLDGPEHMCAVLQVACRHTARCPVPWVVLSQWGEPALVDTAVPYAESDLDRSLVSVPIMDGSALRGVLCAERMHGPLDQDSFCFDDDVRLLGTIANVIAASGFSAALDTVAERAGAGAHQRRFDTSGAAEDEAWAEGADSIIGRDRVWCDALQRASRAARGKVTVMLRGESGTGKEVVARLIHQRSSRRERPFVSVNCGALSESVLESELFGHEKGAFTGAIAQRKGRFELAHGGTLFLDEIGDISPAFQARLLRVLQLGEFERVGGMATQKVDVRVISATHRDLEQEVATGHFRADLYYRLSVVPISLPPLRQRAGDVPLLARRFIADFNSRNGTQMSLDESALSVLSSYPFPGNVRELENAICRAATLSQSTRLSAEDFDWMQMSAAREAFPGTMSARTLDCTRSDLATGASFGSAITDHGVDDEGQGEGTGQEATRERLMAAMDKAGWVQAKAARLLGLTPRQVGYALRKHHIDVRKF